MKNVIRKIITFSLISALLLPLTACQRDETGAHADAIEDALDQLVSEQEYLTHFKCENLDGQVGEQDEAIPKKEKDKENASYEITVLLPDLSDVTVETIQDRMPAFDRDIAAYYAEDYKKHSNDILKEMVLSDDGISWKEETLNVALKKGEEGWNAIIDNEDSKRLVDSLRNDIWNTTVSNLKADNNYHILLVKSDIWTALKTIFEETLYYQSVDIEEIKNGEDGDFIVTIKYHDPEKVYSGLADAFYQEHAKEGRTKYSPIESNSCSSYITSNFEEHFKAFTEAAKESEEDNRKTAEIRVSLDSDLDIQVSGGTSEIKDHITTTKSNLVSAAVEKVNNECVIQEQDIPATQILSGANSGQPILIESAENVTDKHIDFTTEDGTSVLKAFVRSGESLTVHLPSGNYKMIQGWGDKWYGNDLSFGPNGSYKEASQILNIEGGYTYTITLYGVADGNLPTQGIDYPY